MKTKTKYFLSVLSTVILSPIVLFAATTISVDTNIPSGTYKTPISLELKASDSSAKIFYTFKPKGSPQDALLYTGTILIKKSTPVLYFAFTDPQNESKIMQNDYVIQYPTDVIIEAESLPYAIEGDKKLVKNIVIKNNSPETIDLGYWKLQSQAETFEFSHPTRINSGETYSVSSLAYAGAGVVTLKTPDDEERDILLVSEPVIESPKPTPQRHYTPSYISEPVTPSATENTVADSSSAAPVTIPSETTIEATTPTEAATTDASTPDTNTSETVAPAIESVSTEPTENSLSETIKASAIESGEKNNNNTIVIVVSAIVILAVLARLVMLVYPTKGDKKKSKKK